jgi:hypothetical protein
VSRAHPATEALRLASPDVWRRSLLATLRDHEEDWVRDYRDLLVTIAPYHDCARRLGLDVEEAFGSVAEEGPERLRDTVARFGARTDVTPSTFGFELREEPGGLAYAITL